MALTKVQPIIIPIITSSLISILLIFNFAAARPTTAPPKATPPYPPGPAGPQGSVGNQGPSGSQGSQGPQGPQGSRGGINCIVRSNSCYSPAFNGCSVGIEEYGRKVTNSLCMSPDNLQVYTLTVTNVGISCYCHDKREAANGNCYAVIWAC